MRRNNVAFDYKLQAWARDGRWERCGHPEAMDCGCYGRAHAGELIPCANCGDDSRWAVPGDTGDAVWLCALCTHDREMHPEGLRYTIRHQGVNYGRFPTITAAREALRRSPNVDADYCEIVRI